MPGKSPKNADLLEVDGTAMENCGGKDLYSNGSFILVNPDVSGTIKDYVGNFVVVVYESTQEANFKQLVDDGGA
ncbi:hypothetical protein [Vibrio sp. S512-13]|uniref:hypothetical protein n=1 Tax=Vibrio sp. S512-13 TaxID=1620394 RepID=UPI000698DD4A|nr:hypothetical protein [Vibrio sp. S512-13]